jgi:hypothetical protein
VQCTLHPTSIRMYLFVTNTFIGSFGRPATGAINTVLQVLYSPRALLWMSRMPTSGQTR